MREYEARHSEKRDHAHAEGSVGKTVDRRAVDSKSATGIMAQVKNQDRRGGGEPDHLDVGELHESALRPASGADQKRRFYGTGDERATPRDSGIWDVPDNASHHTPISPQAPFQTEHRDECDE